MFTVSRNTALAFATSAALLAGTTAGVTASVGAGSHIQSVQPQHAGGFVKASLAELPAPKSEAETALDRFLQGMIQGQADTVWSMAAEEDQDAFPTPADLLAAYDDAFPQIRNALRFHVVASRVEGDTPILTVALADRDGVRWKAEMSLWKNDASDWTMVGCDIARDASEPPIAQSEPETQPPRASST